MSESETSDSGRFLELLAMHVASGKTIRAAAEESGCSERQGYRIAATAEFKSRVSEIRSEMTNAAVGELSAAASEAVATIRELLNAENEPSVRLNAAKAILNALGPLSELGELRQRIAALESDR
jgi:HEAT repeat protein